MLPASHPSKKTGKAGDDDQLGALVEQILGLSPPTQLGILRTIVPKVLARLTREQRHGFLRDVEGEVQHAVRGEPTYDMRARSETHDADAATSLRGSARAAATYARFLARLSDLLCLTRERAESVAAVVLTALEGCLPASEAADLESQLPTVLRDILARRRAHSGTVATDNDRLPFLQRVASDLHVTMTEAESCTRFVFLALTEQVSPGEVQQVKDRLAPELRDLWPK